MLDEKHLQTIRLYIGARSTILPVLILILNDPTSKVQDNDCSTKRMVCFIQRMKSYKHLVEALLSVIVKTSAPAVVFRCVQSGGVEARWACPKYKESGCPATFSTRIAMADTEPGPGGGADASIQDTRWTGETLPSLIGHYCWSYYWSYCLLSHFWSHWSCGLKGLKGLRRFICDSIHLPLGQKMIKFDQNCIMHIEMDTSPLEH